LCPSLDEVLRRGREREAALQSQLDDQSNRMMELLDREDEAADSRTAELEDVIATLRREAQGLHAAVRWLGDGAWEGGG
jgi:polyhydroxyalkanoate synthesis regulator phasin